jgi:hypothetical protein
MADKTPYFSSAAMTREVLPLVITGIAIVLFSTAGLARMMGWGPDWTDDSGDVLAPDRTALVPVESKARTRAGCAECGEIVSFREIESHDEGTEPGTAGAETAGNAGKPRANSTRNYEITIRMADGSSRVIDGANPAKWRTGERLIVIDGTNPSYP